MQMANTSDQFREGATAYRNARDWTKKQRDKFIYDANQAARQMPLDCRPKNTLAESRTSRPTLLKRDSDTSADELAPDVAKRVRRTPSLDPDRLDSKINPMAVPHSQSARHRTTLTEDGSQQQRRPQLPRTRATSREAREVRTQKTVHI